MADIRMLDYTEASKKWKARTEELGGQAEAAVELINCNTQNLSSDERNFVDMRVVKLLQDELKKNGVLLRKDGMVKNNLIGCRV